MALPDLPVGLPPVRSHDPGVIYCLFSTPPSSTKILSYDIQIKRKIKCLTMDDIKHRKHLESKNPSQLEMQERPLIP